MMAIDPIEFGKVISRLGEQDRQIAEMRDDVNSLRNDIRSLLELANKGKGAIFMLTSLGAIIGAVVTWITHNILSR